jgi:hypothetical protein
MKVISLSMVPTQKKGDKKIEVEKIIWVKTCINQSTLGK